jgi:Cupin domain
MAIAKQQKQIETLTAGLQKVSAQLELSKPKSGYFSGNVQKLGRILVRQLRVCTRSIQQKWQNSHGPHRRESSAVRAKKFQRRWDASPSPPTSTSGIPLMSRFCVFRRVRLPIRIIRTTPIEAGDAFIFKPGEPHQISNDTTEDMILYVVADNPIGDTYYQPDSNKWGVPIPERRNVRSQPLDYFDGEE